MTATDFIVAIELGSSKITGIAGKKNSDGGIQVMAFAQEHSSAFIRKGIIYNLDKTAQCLTSIINKLEAALDATIGKVYVGIGGQSLRTVKNTISRHLNEEVIISKELIDEVISENTQIPIIDMEILAVTPQEYRIGNNLQADPVGVLSSHIEGRFLNVIARSTIKKNIARCFEQAKIDIAGYFISPLITAEATLTESEKRSGCALIDFGADTTTISVFQKNILRHLSVIPLGGNCITLDICSQQLEEEEAETLKTKYGSAVSEPEEEGDENKMYPIDEKRSFDAKLLNEIIESRVDEIVANIWNQISVSGYEDKLLAGVIITGGASNLKGIDDAIRKRIKLEKGRIDKVRIAKYVQYSIKGTVAEALQRDGSLNTILGLVYAGDENCYKPEPESVISEDWTNAVPGKLFEEEEEDIQERIKESKKKKEEEKKENKEKKEKEKGPNKFGKWINNMTNQIFSEDQME